jgi:hypothetical protein
MCKHKNITIHTVESYKIPKGWNWLVQQDNIDMEDWVSIPSEEEKVFCDDCGKTLE